MHRSENKLVVELTKDSEALIKDLNTLIPHFPKMRSFKIVNYRKGNPIDIFKLFLMNSDDLLKEENHFKRLK